MNIRTIKGTKDILPSEIIHWQELESSFHTFFQNYGYKEIRTPIFEKTELFSRGVGSDTDIVSKEMYSWNDKNGDSLTLRPELTASIVRAYIQNNLANESPFTKLYYFGSLFRRERPQKGRQRQFHQFGIESIGSPFPECDAEVISSAYLFLHHLELPSLTLRLNSIGSTDARQSYCNALVNYLTPHRNTLSEISQTRLKTNPLRILDTKIPHEIDLLKNAPVITDFLSIEDKNHFKEVLSILDTLKIPYVQDNQLVRGLDYYCQTTFEITSKSLGGQDAICGGGRYNNLVKMLGGKPTPAMGFAAGVERILIGLNENASHLKKEEIDFYIIGISDKARETGAVIANTLRQSGYCVELDFLRRSMKSQFREANKKNSRFTIILGEDELKYKKVTIKNMKTGDQQVVKDDSIIQAIKK